MARTTRIGWLSLLILGMGLLIGRPVLAEAVCAQVKIEIQQELTLERQAFDAMMRINNGLDTLPIENVDITVSFADEDGNSVLATNDPNNTEAKFFIRLDTMDNIADVSGDGVVAPNTTAEIHWLIIPAPGAAEDLPGGKLFFVGARLSYTLGGVPESVEVTPDFITVKPLPRLTLDYFLTRDVIGDDAFTPEIEPSEPYTLGVRVRNDGIAVANNLKIDSAQPQIIENELGLAIGFEIIGSSIDDQPAAPNLLIDFGSVDGNSARVGRWQMTSSLSGEFIDFDVTFTHADELGGQLTSILQATHGHFLIRDVRVDLPGRDNVRDFLAKDGDVYRIYESEGLDTDVINASAQANLSVLDTQATYTDYRLTLPAAAGFSYVQLPDPQGGAYQVISAIRADGKVMSTDNVWTSRTRNRDTLPPSWHYHLNLFDVDSTGTYTVRLGPTVTGPEPPVIAFLPDRPTSINTAMGFLVEASDPNGDPIALSASPLPAGAAFIDNGDGTGYFNWTPIQGQAGSYIVRFTASDGSLEASRLMTITVNGDGDSDGDGMDDDWELLWFETLARDGTGDYDGDGISDLSEFQNGTDPARAPGPGQPEPLAPLYTAEVDHLAPELRVQNGQHGLAQTVSYHFEVYRDAGLNELIAGSGAIAEDASGETAWVIDTTLDDNTQYYWRVRAHDGATYSEWARSEFFVNTVNDPPSAPQINWPADGGRMPAMTPRLEVIASTDSDQDELYYSVQLFEDAALTLPVNEPWGRYADPQSPSVVRWQGVLEDVGLVESATYYWVVTVTDEHGVATQSPAAQFTVDGINNAPPEPTLITPAAGAEVASAELDLVVGAVVDPDGDTVQYRFELDTVATFDSPDKLVSEPLLAAGGNAIWLLPILNDNTRYYWRVKASDGLIDSRWANGQFFVNTANDVPPVPLPGNLDVAGWSGTLTPTLYLAPAEDIDGDIQRYEFELYAYSRASGVGSLLASAQTTEPQLDLQTLAPLATEYTWLAWRARAIDEHDAGSDWMAPVSLFIDNVTVPEPLTLDAPASLTVAEGSITTIDITTSGISAPVCLRAPDWQNLNLVWPLEADFLSFADLGDGRATMVITPDYWNYVGVHTLDIVAGHRGTECEGDLRTAPFAPVVHRLTITVNDTNRTPVFTPHADVVATEGETLSLSVVATDPDGDGPTLTYSATGLPPGLTIDSVFLGGENINEVGTISGTLPYDAAGTYNVIVDVVDNGVPPASAQTSFTIDVTDTNRAPTWGGSGTLTATEGQTISWSQDAFDPDGDDLTYSADGLPEGLSLDTMTGVISGSPVFGTAGSYTINIGVYDNGTPPLSDTGTTILVVVASTLNQPPAVAWVTPIEDGMMYALGPVIPLEATASDTDGSVSSVRFFVNGVLLDTLTAAPYVVDWMPTVEGSYTLTVEVTDDGGETASAMRMVDVVDTQPHVTSEIYYVLNPRMSLGDAYVVSLEDNNLIRVGGTQLSLNRYERGVLPAAELTQGAAIMGSGAFDVGSDVTATDVPVSQRLSGVSFVVPQYGIGNRYYLLSPHGDAQVQIQLGAQTTTLTLPRGQVIAHDGDTNDSDAIRIRSDLPIVIARATLQSGEVSHDVMPVPPAATELWGKRGEWMLIGAIEDDTLVSVYAEDTWLPSIRLSAGRWGSVRLGRGNVQGQGTAMRIISNKPVGAIMGSDFDGDDQVAFLPTKQLGTRFGIPVDTQYVSVACTEPQTQITLYVPGQAPQVQSCAATGPHPGHVYFGNAANGVHIPAGAYLESEAPVYVMYEPAASNDEHNLMGTNPTPEAYYVLNSRMSSGDASVVSLEDDNLIQVGTTQLPLNRYERGTLPAADLTQGAVISVKKAFDFGSDLNGTDVPVSNRFASRQFVMPQGGGGHRYALLSPYGDAQVYIFAGEQTTYPDATIVSLPQGQVIQHDAVETSGAIRIFANLPIVVSHAGVYGGVPNREAMPIPPATTELWGLRSSNAEIGALEDGTVVDIYADDGTWQQKTLSAGERTGIEVGQNAAHGMGSALRLVANKPISAIQSSDGDGYERTAFFPTQYLGMHFGIPVDTQYVAIACTKAQTKVRLYAPDREVQERICNADGDRPGHIHFGDTINGAHVPAGAYLQSEAPIHVIYEAAASDDEHNLMGTVPIEPVMP